jgi:hypothetical protein
MYVLVGLFMNLSLFPGKSHFITPPRKPTGPAAAGRAPSAAAARAPAAAAARAPHNDYSMLQPSYFPERTSKYIFLNANLIVIDPVCSCCKHILDNGQGM